MKYSHPCDSCKKPCKNPTTQYKNCRDYAAFINTWWKFFNICYRRLCCYERPDNREKFVYEHPDVYRRYIMTSPCDKCKAKENCQTVCATYWRWWDDRMEWFRRRLE